MLRNRGCGLCAARACSLEKVGKSAGVVAGLAHDVGASPTGEMRRAREIYIAQLVELACEISSASACLEEVVMWRRFGVVARATTLADTQSVPGDGVFRDHLPSTIVRMKFRRSIIGASEKRNRSNCVSASSCQPTQEGTTKMSPFSNLRVSPQHDRARAFEDLEDRGADLLPHGCLGLKRAAG